MLEGSAINYYEHHLGDYLRDTAHLSMLEDAAYRRLLDRYYASEHPLPHDLGECCRIARAVSKAEREAVARVLVEFFDLADDGYHQKRADEEIARLRAKSQKARESINQRWERIRAKQQPNAERIADEPTNGIRTYNDRSTDDIHRAPVPRLQTQYPPTPLANGHTLVSPPDKPAGRVVVSNGVDPPADIAAALLGDLAGNGGKGQGAHLPPCPYGDIVAAYHAALPNLPRVRLLPDGRKRALAKLWRWVLTTPRTDGTPRATDEAGALAWLRSYFARAAENDWLMGRNGRSADHANWQPDIDYLASDRGLRAVIERTGTQEATA